MISKILNWLKKPYPRLDSALHQLIVTGLMGGSVFMFLLIFQPFDIESTQSYKVFFLIGYGLITFIVTFLILVSVTVIPLPFFMAENWTIKKNFLLIFLNIILIAIANWFYTKVVAGFIDTKEFSLITFIFCTLSVAFVPLILFTFFTEILFRKKHENRAKNITQTIELRTSSQASQALQILSDIASENFSLLQRDFICMAADGNYINLYYFSGDHVCHKLIRSSMKKQTALLDPVRSIIRCHRSYIVNLDQVSTVTGNARGYFLKMNQLDFSIPISRALSQSILNRLE